ncbi:MAG: ribosome-associated translation inhibitor RaiA [Anaerolineae bacterium]|nr:ribosome-associated translation inhibitor RaiA [Anaerolineae bacterium]
MMEGTMDLTIRGENVTITPELEGFVQKKLSKLGRYMPNIASIHVELGVQKSHRGPDIVSAQITLRHSRGAILRTEEKMDKVEHGTLKAAIVAASDKMYRRISRFKGKRRGKRVRDRYIMTEEELTQAEPLPSESEEGVSLYDDYDVPEADLLEPQVIRRKTVGINAMHEEEAIEQMELLGHNFFLFFNADTNSVNVVYKRGNGGYGVLEPQVE